MLVPNLHAPVQFIIFSFKTSHSVEKKVYNKSI